jgi:hypothetical protein
MLPRAVMPEGGQGLGGVLRRIEQRHGRTTNASHDIEEFSMTERAGDEGLFRCTRVNGGDFSEPLIELETEPLVQLRRREGEEGDRQHHVDMRIF